MTFTIKIYKDYLRTTPKGGVDKRLFYKYLKEFVDAYKKKYPGLNNKSLLVSVNGKETYRKRKGLEEAGIDNIQNMIDYLGIEPEIIMVDGSLTEDRTKLLSEIYVLEIR